MSDSLQDRKKHHLDLTWEAQLSSSQLDNRFLYEPLNPPREELEVPVFSEMKFPLWISSMTGGTEQGAMINKNLALAAAEFGLGMGLGSCRILIENNFDRLADFDVRRYIGDQPLYANLGIAQLSEYHKNDEWPKVIELLKRLQADGLIIHLNPLQELFQPNGDEISFDFLETIKATLDHISYPIIVKEVGQGFGPKSLLELMKLPLKAIDTASAGGTNFALLELLRNQDDTMEDMSGLTRVGQSASDMVTSINQILKNHGSELLCTDFIISGGVSDFLDGYYLTSLVNSSAIYGQASSLLRHATTSYEDLQRYIQNQIKGYEIARRFLDINRPDGR